MELKPGYKQTEVGIIPEDWEVKRLRDIFNITAGGDFTPLHSSSIQDEIYCYPIYSNSILDKGLYGYCSYSDHDKNSITVTARGTLGVAHYRDHKFTAIGRVLILKPKVPLDGRFLSEFINNRVNFVMESTGVPQLTAPQISKYIVLAPPIPEQQAIATVLSDVDALLSSLNKLIAKKHDIKRATMQQLLTGKKRLPRFQEKWEVRRLGEFILSRPPRRKELDSDLVTFLGMEDLSEQGGILNQTLMYQKDIGSGLTFFERNDVLVAKITPCFENGKGAFLNQLPTRRGYGSTEFHVLRAKPGMESSYLYYHTRMPEFRQKLEKEMVGTAGQKRVPINAITNYSIQYLPLLEEQKAIAEVLSDMDAEIVALEQKRAKIQALKQGMMQELLAGRIRLPITQVENECSLNGDKTTTKEKSTNE